MKGQDGPGGSMRPDDRLAALQDSDPKRLVLELVRYARWRLWRLQLNDFGLAGGVSPADLAQDAIEKFLSGKRHWNTSLYPTVLDFLKSVVQSQISNLLRSPTHGRRDRVDVEQLAQADAGGYGLHTIGGTDPEREYFDRVAEETAATLLRELRMAVRRLKPPQLRSEVRSVLNAVCRGSDNPTAIALTTRIPRHRVYAHLSRLERMAAALFVRLFPGADAPSLGE